MQAKRSSKDLSEEAKAVPDEFECPPSPVHKPSKWVPPPSSIEEAAALLGTSITRLNNESVYHTTTSPQGLHSSFSTVKPVPCSELYVRLASLANILTAHIDMEKGKENKEDEDGHGQSKSIATTIDAAPSIIPLLHKLFTISSSLALTPIYLHSSSDTIPPFSALASIAAVTSNSVAANDTAVSTGMNMNMNMNNKLSLQRGVSGGNSSVSVDTSSTVASSRDSSVQGSSSNSNNGSASGSNNNGNNNNNGNGANRKNKNLEVPPKLITPPLCSKPIRHLWIKCITLAHRLSPTHLLPSTNPQILLGLYFAAAGGHPKSAKSQGGCRVAALGVLREMFQDKELGKRYIRAMLPDVITLCHNGLKSSGANDAVHRSTSIQCAIAALVAWRDAPPPIMISKSSKTSMKSFLSENMMDERILSECIRLMKKGAEDKYPEVRHAAAEFASVFCSVSIAEEPRNLGNSRKEFNALQYLDDTMAVCARNLDDEGVGVGCKWSETLARCVCSAVEFHQGIIATNQNYVSEMTGGDSKGKGTTGKNNFASTLKTFNEHRKSMGTIGSYSSITLENAIKFLVQYFIKVKGEGANRLGGSSSKGGRLARVGISLTLVHLIRLQLEVGGIGVSTDANCLMNPSDVLDLVMTMLEFPDELDSELSLADSHATSFDDMENPITIDGSTSTSPPKRKKASSVGGFLRNMSGIATSHPSDASLARMATCRVLRRGLCENISESMQLTILRDLVESCRCAENATSSAFNRHQTQVALVEISNLATALGEACASTLDDLLPMLESCLSDSDHGVRHEAATAYQAVVTLFPSVGRKYIITSIGFIQVHQDEILALCASSRASGQPVSKISVDKTPTKRRNRRRQGQENTKVDVEVIDDNIGKSFDHQYSIHGNALVLSMILHVLPTLSGGMPTELLDIIIAVSDNLISCQGNTNLVERNPGSLVTCVRSGYNIICGALTIGPKATIPHLKTIFGIWTRSAALIDEEKNRLSPSQSLSVLEPFVTSILIFLQYNSELLLSVPDALSRTTQILERIFPILVGYSQLQSSDLRSITLSRLDSAKAAMMEVFSWLPTGSFPLITSSVFSFASRQIQMETKGGVSCTLTHLLSNEDNIVDSCATTRIKRSCQAGNRYVEESMQLSYSKRIGPSEREAVLHLFVGQGRDEINRTSALFCGVANYSDRQLVPPPTPLHRSGGNWIAPPSPSRSSGHRLLNAAIHVFAATFQSQDSHQQSIAMKMMEDLMKSKIGQGHNCPVNVSASILACLKALPSSPSSGGTLYKVLPHWMMQAAKVLFSILAVPDSQVRRAAAESLGTIASLGTTEKANVFQTSILRNLEEMMSSDVPETTAQQKPQTSTSSWNSASCLLTLGCFQRGRNQFTSAQHEEMKTPGSDITTIMMKLLPYIATQSADEDSFVTRTFALHSFGLLLSHSGIFCGKTISNDKRNQILSKAVEVVESNFFSAWMTNSVETDIRVLEAEKAAVEPAFLAVLIRLMAFLVPRLHLILRDDANVASRFSSMVSLILSTSNYHPSVVAEGLTFFECLSKHKKLLAAISIAGTKNPALGILPVSFNIIEAQTGSLLDTEITASRDGCIGSIGCLRSAISSLYFLVERNEKDVLKKCRDSKIICHLFAVLERTIGSREYCTAQHYRSIVPSYVDHLAESSYFLCLEIVAVIEMFVKKERSVGEDDSRHLLYWLHFSRLLLSGDGSLRPGDDQAPESFVTASQDSLAVIALGGPCRWQVRCFLATISQSAIDAIMKLCRDDVEVELSLYIGSLVSVACSLAVSTCDDSEIYFLQISGLKMLHAFIGYFSACVDPEDTDSMILDQFISQILPSIKHALNYDTCNSEDSLINEGSRDLFVTGCRCFLLLAKEGLIPDIVAMKRLLKATLPSEQTLSLAPYPHDDIETLSDLHLKPRSFVENRTSMLLPRIGSLWAIADIYLSGELGRLHDKFLGAIENEICSNQVSIAVNSAALAIDSCRLKSDVKSANLKSGLTFTNLKDIDNASKDTMIISCPTMACFALCLIVDTLDKEQEASEELALLSWLPRIIEVVLVIFYSTADAIESGIFDENTLEAVMRCCFVLGKTIDNQHNKNTSALPDETKHIMHRTLDIIKLLACRAGELEVDKRCDSISAKLELAIQRALSQALVFVESMCHSKSLQAKIGKDFLLVGVISPIISFESCQSGFDSAIQRTIVISSLKSVRFLITSDENDKEVIKSLVGFCLGILEQVDIAGCSELKSSAQDFIIHCLSNSLISEKEKIICVDKLALFNCWDAWQMCMHDQMAAATCSLTHVRRALSDGKNCKRHGEVLVAIVTVAKEHKELLPNIISSVGANVFEIFKQYGTRQEQKDRILLCANCMKFIMLTYQFLLSRNGDDVSSEHAFISTVFEVLVDIVSHNGLPNQNATALPGADPALGRMSAQFFVHVLRTSPATFKACVGSMSQETRSIFEKSVRADMSGYPSTAPTKKRLNFKSFKQ
eukprot:CAMPEP_0194107668 /NCGR_PEP_ID=MMETSP0150-20130528/7501_1 /TAXON_ID=122233 /ORGANISM="Chaetoceros debilis, Strain MM31A-1" /LENGTH=2481 /DNA_ID=CAMNT_0038796151 /DNA_START=23 /DNA_END=7465 /DNA_ORIENTATION=-